ncbi:hypothetical protein ACS0TY_016416 [Phlomoides rotata]
MRIQVITGCLLMSLFQILFVLQVSSQCLDDQRLLLLQLKSSLVYDTELSTKLVSWSQSVDCCNWDGVACVTSGHVIGLDLAYEGISGGIDNSSGVFGLQYLQSLNLAWNIFNGDQIPKGLQNLTNLAHLNLSNAGFVGQVPIEVSTMKRLVVLDLSSLYQARQPLKLKSPNLQKLVENLNELRELYLDFVDVPSQKSEWCQALSSSLPNLTTLSLRYCGLSGPLDSSLSQLRSLSVLRLEGNNLSTTVPNFFRELTNLTTLILSSCSLRGPFPESIFQVPTLQILDLYQNPLLSGAIPQLPINSSLRTMLLGYTNLSGSLPESISNLRMLSKVDISNCNFTGMIPPFISSLTELIHLDFSSNSFTGVIPPFHMSGKLAIILKASLTGSLTSNHFEGLSKLESIYLVNNSLNGSIPVSLFALPSLHKLQLSNNKFSGQISEFPISFTSHGSWINLQIIDIASNNISGELSPVSIANWRGMTQNDGSQLRANHLRFDFLNLNNFYYQDAVTVTIKGQQLEFIKILTVFTAIDLSCNNITATGMIPKTVGLLTSLYALNLSHNAFTGEVPSSIGNLTQLGSLDLSANQLTGEIPQQLTSLTFLSFLNLSFNKLIGKIPTGSQFQTFSPESYVGNSRLCGFPLNTSCDGDSYENSADSAPSSDVPELVWVFVSACWGYVVGVIIFFVSLVFCDQLREQFNKQLDKLMGLIFPRQRFSNVSKKKTRRSMRNR